MANVKISQLPAASTPLAGSEEIPLVQGGITKQVTVDGLLTSANLGTPSVINLTYATNVPVNEATGVLPVANGGTGAATAAAGIQNLLPSYSGNASRRLGLNSGATALEWVADGGGTVTSVGVSVPAFLSVSNSPITASGTIALSYSGVALPVLNGGTGETTANAAFNALAPSQTGNSGKYLTTDGTNTSWGTNPLGTVTSVDVSGGTTGLTTSGGPVTTSGTITIGGTLATTNGGTGLTSFTANGVIFASSTSTLTSGSALTFDGTTFAVSAAVTGDSFKKGDSGNFIIGGGLGGTTYLDSGSATDLVFRPAGTEGMRLTSTGLGIGTSSPSYKLHAVDNGNINATSAISNSTAGTSSLARFLAISDAGSAIFAMTSSSYTDISGAQDAMLLNANNASGGIAFALDGTLKMKLDSAGNLGIGTSSPAVKLDVNGSGRFRGFDSGYYNENVLAIGNASYDPKIGLASNGGYRWNTRIADVGASGAGNYVIRYEEGSLDTVTITRDGNLGLGVTPSAWGSNFKAIQVNDTGASLWSYRSGATSNEYLYLSNNSYNNNTNDIYIRDGAAVQYRQLDGTHAWFNSASGNAGDAISFTQAMTLDASGNLGVGTTSPAAKLDVRLAASNGGDVINIGNINGSVYGGLGIVAASPYSVELFGTVLTFRTGGNTTGSSTERARIDSSGNLLIGTTSAVSGGGVLQVSNGITFPATQSASSDANTLDDYEEGTWTPVLTASSSDPTVTYSSSSGTYVKIGSTVFVTVDCRWSAISGGSGNLTMNLPFTATTNYATGIVGEKSGANVSTGSNLTFESNGGLASLVFLDNTASGGTGGYTVTSLGSTGYLIFSFTYRSQS